MLSHASLLLSPLTFLHFPVSHFPQVDIIADSDLARLRRVSGVPAELTASAIEVCVSRVDDDDDDDDDEVDDEDNGRG